MSKLDSRTLQALRKMARAKGLRGYSRLKKAELIQLIEKPIQRSAPKERSRSQASGRLGRNQIVREELPRESLRLAKIRGNSSSGPKKTKVDRESSRTIKKGPAPAPARSSAPPPLELPESYQDGRMLLLTRDPFWLYCYWDLTESQQARLWQGENPTLRVLEEHTSKGPQEVKRIALSQGARSWYIQIESAGRLYRAELGNVDQKGRFVPLLASNSSPTPRAGTAPKVEAVFAAASLPASQAHDNPDTQALERQADRFYGLSVGVGKSGTSSAEAVEIQRRPLEVNLSSQQFQSGARASGGTRFLP